MENSTEIMENPPLPEHDPLGLEADPPVPPSPPEDPPPLPCSTPEPMQLSSVLSNQPEDVSHGHGGVKSPESPPSKRRCINSVGDGGDGGVISDAENNKQNSEEVDINCAGASNNEQNGSQNSGSLDNSNSQYNLEDFGFGDDFGDGAFRQEFAVIDDLGSDVDGDADYGGDEDGDSDDYVDEDEIDALLDAGVKNYKKVSKQEENGDPTAPTEKEKVVLIEKVKDPFDILPEGWVIVSHNSGMPVYLHKESRVCTLSKPYFLGPGSARKHDIPLSAVPCLQYRRAVNAKAEAAKLADESKDDTASDIPEQCPVKIEPTEGENKAEEDEEKTEEKSEEKNEKSEDGDEAKKELPANAKIATAEDHKQKCLDFMELRDYCQNLFEFRTITVKRFKTWKDRRRHNLENRRQNKPELPKNTKLITLPSEGDEKRKSKEFVLNPHGKSDVCILHEYVQHALRVQPKYVYKELENSMTPYSATVVIHGIEYGTGCASRKKTAKAEAARKSLEILIPDMYKMKDEKEKSSQQDTDDLSFFDQVKIEDPRVTELCNKTGQLAPYQILTECLRRNFGFGSTYINVEMKTLKPQKGEITMKVGKHEAKVICKNKRDGKQQASQAILQKMHPHIQNWGSILRLYGKSQQVIKERKLSVEEIMTAQEALNCSLCEQPLQIQQDTEKTENVCGRAKKSLTTDTEKSSSVENEDCSGSAETLSSGRFSGILDRDNVDGIMVEIDQILTEDDPSKCCVVTKDIGIQTGDVIEIIPTDVEVVSSAEDSGNVNKFADDTENVNKSAVSNDDLIGLQTANSSERPTSDESAKTVECGKCLLLNTREFVDKMTETNFQADDPETSKIFSICSDDLGKESIPDKAVKLLNVETVITGVQTDEWEPSISTTEYVQVIEEQVPEGSIVEPLLSVSTLTTLDVLSGMTEAQLSRIHRATQTNWEGFFMYHKSTQYPECLYVTEPIEQMDFGLGQNLTVTKLAKLGTLQVAKKIKQATYKGIGATQIPMRRIPQVQVDKENRIPVITGINSTSTSTSAPVNPLDPQNSPKLDQETTDPKAGGDSTDVPMDIDSNTVPKPRTAIVQDISRPLSQADSAASQLLPNSLSTMMPLTVPGMAQAYMMPPAAPSMMFPPPNPYYPAPQPQFYLQNTMPYMYPSYPPGWNQMQ